MWIPSLYSSSPQHIEECCGWLRQKLNELNDEQYQIVHQHEEQVSLSKVAPGGVPADR